MSILWVTNLAAPYRRPVWRELATRNRLTVALLESNEGLAHDSTLNRGQDWLHDLENGLLYKELATWKYRRGESRYYTFKSVRAPIAIREFDIIVFGGWESPAYWSLLLASFIWGRARVGFYESPRNTMTHTSGPIAFLRAVFFRSMTRVVVPGPAAYAAVLGMGVSPDRILVGFNAVDVRAFNKAALSIGDACDKGSAGHRYLYVGQLIGRKRVREIVQTFLQVAEPEDQLTIVGTGELFDELQTVARANRSQVCFLGHVNNSELPRIMANHHTLILASEREVWGLVVNEALASGMQVVVTENCGVSRSVEGMRGVHIAQEDLQDLAELMRCSRTSWTGRIRNPEILEYTPSRFASVFDEAFAAARQDMAPDFETSERRENQ